MAKKLLSKRLLDDDIWEEIEEVTKKKILDKVWKEMAADSKYSRLSKTTKVSSHKSGLHSTQTTKHSIKRPSREKIRKTYSDTSKTPRGIVTSYGEYFLVPIDFKQPKPDNECFRMNGIFDYRSPTSPQHKKEEDNRGHIDKAEASLVATSDDLGIDITTKDLILNNISFPGHEQEFRYSPEHSELENETPQPKKLKLPVSPISCTMSSASKSKLEENIDNLLSQAKADSFIQDRRSESDLTQDRSSESSFREITHRWSSTRMFEYNHGHDSYSPTHPQLSEVSYTSGTSSTSYTPIPVYFTSSTSRVPSPEKTVQCITVENTTSTGKRQIFPRILPPSPDHPSTNKSQLTVNQEQNKPPMIMPPNSTNATANQRSDKKCPICDRLQTNMKKHVAFSHLGQSWWGILPELTCWKCRIFHNKEGINRCEGSFNYSTHRFLLLQRYIDFFKFLLEDLNCASPQQLLALFKQEGVCDKVYSTFTAEELKYLDIIDEMSGLTYSPHRDPRNPTRLTDLLHWRVLACIIKYASQNGTITGPALPNPNIAVIDTRSDILEFYNVTSYLGRLDQHPRMQLAGRLTNFNLAITDILDPAILNSSVFATLIKDPRVLISLGARPTADTGYRNSLTINSPLLISSPKIVAIGGVGLDMTAGLGTMSNQIKVLRVFMQVAAENRLPIRVFTVGCHEDLLREMESHLPTQQFIHYLNFQGTYNQALEFLIKFPNGYLGMGRKMLKPSPDLVEIALKVDVKRLLPESNAPYRPLDFQDISIPPEVAEVMSAIANIKEMDRTSFSKTIRMNIHRIYKI